MRDAGSTDGAIPIAACPAGVRNGNVNCDQDTDTVCQTQCNNMMRYSCVCVDSAGGPGGNADWICASQAMDCQP